MDPSGIYTRIHLVVYLVCATQGGKKLHSQDKIQAKNKTEKLQKKTDYNKKIKPKIIYYT